MRKTQILMNKLVYLDLSILDQSKTLICEFWYDFVKPKYGENVKLLCFTFSPFWCFLVDVKADDIYKDIGKDVETVFSTSNFEIDRLLPKGKYKKVIGLIKDELGEQILKKFPGLSAKAYSYSKDNNDEDKKRKRYKKENLNFKNIKTVLEQLKQIEKTGDSRYIYQNELDKAYFQHDMAYGDIIDRRTAADKVLRDKVFNTAKNLKHDEHQRWLASMVYKCFDKKLLVAILKKFSMKN